MVVLPVLFNVGALAIASVGFSSATDVLIVSTVLTKNARKAIVPFKLSDAPRVVFVFPRRVFAMAIEIARTTRMKRTVTVDEGVQKVHSDVITGNVCRPMSFATRLYLVEMVATNLEGLVERDIAVELLLDRVRLGATMEGVVLMRSRVADGMDVVTVPTKSVALCADVMKLFNLIRLQIRYWNEATA